jgi:hypothetical protein
MATDRRSEAKQDAAVAGSFPASDPPSGMPETGARAVAPEEMMKPDAAAPGDAVTLTRGYPDMETAKLALEGLVRQGPVDRAFANVSEQGGGAELRVAVPPGDVHRIEALLSRV